MESESIVTRREMMEQTLAAAAFFSSAHIHPGAPPQPDLLSNYQPKFFSPTDFEALRAFTEILIPSDDTPGAREAYCAQFIDFVVHGSTESPQTQANWTKAMQSLKDVGFHQATASRRVEIVTEIAGPEIDPTAHHAAFPAYRLIKQQTAFAFYTSRNGMIGALDYKGNSYNVVFPACNHPEHQTV